MLLRGARLDAPAALLLGSLVGLTLWVGITMVWSTSPDRTWSSRTARSSMPRSHCSACSSARACRARASPSRCRAARAVVGWALLAKCVPALYGGLRARRAAALAARLLERARAALHVGVPLALWLAARRRLAEASSCCTAATVTLLLTYSRFGVALACVAAAAWVVLDRNRVESLVAVALGGGAGAAVFGVALALPGITSDGKPRSVRAHDGWIFALVVLARRSARRGWRMRCCAGARCRPTARRRGSSASQASPRSRSRSRGSP